MPSLQEPEGISGVAGHFPQARRLCWDMCCALHSLCIPGASPSLRQLVTDLAGLSLSLIDCLEVRVWALSSLSLVAPSRWKQLSVDVLNPRHMLWNWFHSNQFLPLPWMFFPSWHQSEHFKLRLHHVILLLKKKKKINVLDQWHDGSIYWVGQNVHLGFSLRSYRNPNEPCGQPNIWEVPREGDLLHHPASWHDEDLESKSSHNGRNKPVRNKPFLLSTTKASSVTSAKLKVNWEKL